MRASTHDGRGLMRRGIAAALTVGLVAGGTVSAAAQDEGAIDERQRVEVTEAGVAVAFPVGWDADVEMRAKEDWGLYDEGFADAPVLFWNVVYASEGGRPWCDLVWYPAHPLSLADHAERFEALMTPTHADVERAIESELVALPAGEAIRFVIHNQPTADFTTTYLLGAGDSRYLLQCVADERAADDWLAVAESVALLATTDEDVGESAEEE